MGAMSELMIEQMESDEDKTDMTCLVCGERLTHEEVEYCGDLCSYHHYAAEKEKDR